MKRQNEYENATKRYAFMKSDIALRKYSNWFKGIRVGFPNGLTCFFLIYEKYV